MAQIMGGDLYHLWRVSEVHLPRIADVYYDASRALGGATGGDADGFRATTSSNGYYTSSPVGAAWAEVRDELQLMYQDIGGTILDASAAVRRARQAYVDADMASSDALSNVLNDPTQHNSDDPLSNPPAEGADDDPGEPAPRP